MTLLWFLFVSILCALLITNAELITSLPGQPSNVTFKQYSGYIVTNAHYGRAQFYYFVEAQSKSPLSRPLTLWFGGAYLCSNIGFGPFMEHGPFRLGKNAKLIKNEFSWNLESNMLYVESPIGFGFSYSNTTSDYNILNDTMIANENMKFLLKWFEEFPQYRNHDVYLAGDSAGGYLVPPLAALVLQYNTKESVKPIKLKGIALGNPLLDTALSLDMDEFFFYHGITSVELFALEKKICTFTTYTFELSYGNLSANCLKRQNEFTKEVAARGLDFEDLLMRRDCMSPNSLLHPFGRRTAFDDPDPDPCTPDEIVPYLNRPEVQKALHVNTTHLPYPWGDCRGALDNQTDNLVVHDNNIPTLSALLKKHIPILLFSGDQDILVPVTQTRKTANILARDLKLTTLQKNGPWYNGYKQGGFSQTFRKSRKGKHVTNLIFATVMRGSHFVSFTSPPEALTLLKAFLKGSPPPRTRFR